MGRFSETFANVPGAGTHAGSPLEDTDTLNGLLCAINHTCGHGIDCLEKITWQ